MNRKNIIIYLCILYGCSGEEKVYDLNPIEGLNSAKVYSVDSQPKFDLTLIKEVAFVDDDISGNWFENHYWLDWFAGIEVDNRGRVYIGEYSELTIHVFDSDGTYLTRLGRKGHGPGEFSGLADMRILSGQLYVYDPLQFRTTVFSLDTLKPMIVHDADVSSVSNSIEGVDGWLVHRQLLMSEEQTYLIGFMRNPRNANVESPHYNLNRKRPVKYFLFNEERDYSSNAIFELPDDEHIMADVGGQHYHNFFPLPFLNTSQIEVSGGNNIYTVWTEEFIVEVYDSAGFHQYTLHHPLERPRINREDLHRMYGDGTELSNILLENGELPDYWPAVNRILVDNEERIWISTNIEDLEVHEWWVLENQGELFARFELARNESIEKVHDGYIYTRRTDEESRLQKIVRYAYELEEI